MHIHRTKLNDAYIIQPDKISDERGFFARGWCIEEFRANDINETFVQANIVYSTKKGTLRGFHYQTAPHEEAKLIRCISGKIYDVIIDLRNHSSTYLQWEGFNLNSSDHTLLFIPKGFAHAYMTLEDNTEVYYMVSEFYSPQAERGIRWNDSFFHVDWPNSGPSLVSQKDNTWEDFRI